MDIASMQCHGCGSTNVSFNPQSRRLICNQCGKEEYYSRATLNVNGKVVYAKQNAINFFQEGRYETAKEYAQDVLNIFMDNAPALYIMAYYEGFALGKYDAIHRFFQKMDSVALEYDEVKELMALFLASPYKLMDYEENVIKTVATNLQSEEDASCLCDFIDKLCPYLISKWPSMSYFKPALIDMYCELAEHCVIPKTCFALLNAIQANPDSPYPGDTFFLKSKSRYFYENFVLPVGRIITAMADQPMKAKFVAAYEQRKKQYENDALG